LRRLTSGEIDKDQPSNNSGTGELTGLAILSVENDVGAALDYSGIFKFIQF
jgi:hypothetical protein